MTYNGVADYAESIGLPAYSEVLEKKKDIYLNAYQRPTIRYSQTCEESEASREEAYAVISSFQTVSFYMVSNKSGFVSGIIVLFFSAILLILSPLMLYTAYRRFTACNGKLALCVCLFTSYVCLATLAGTYTALS